ncbi:MAG: TetR/AcrR family transcriptional regulator [Candidatus Aminicenantes bacterium]|nr:TetR/AcrR family transcriptional regulator [Candidatus Aminicenantes bacterium]
MKTKIVSKVSYPNNQPYQRILERSRELFFRYGYSRLSMDEIAEDLGVSKATLYRYFPDKEALLRAVIGKTQEQILSTLKAISDDEKSSVREKLSAFLTFLSQFMSGLTREFVQDLKFKLPEIWKELEVFRREKVFPVFSEIVAEGVRKNEIRSDLDGRLFLEMFFYLAQEFMNPDWLIKNDYAPSKLLESIIRIVFFGIFLDDSQRETLKSKNQVKEKKNDQKKRRIKKT